MTKRQDGKETRQNLLHAACEIFAQKGYRAAKVANICKLAGANMAAVNYYFQDKANLYVETWRYVFDQFEEPLLTDLEDSSPSGKLRQYIRVLLKNYTAEGAAGHFSRLYMMELVNPSGLNQDVWHDLIEPRRQKLLDIIRGIIGPDADHESVLLCELSVINQCRVLATIKPDDLEYFLGQPLGPGLLDRLAEHIAIFSLAGIDAVGKDRA